MNALIRIYTNDNIQINGEASDYGVKQYAEGTSVYNIHTGDAVKMPRQRYTLSTDSGRDVFSADLMGVIS